MNVGAVKADDFRVVRLSRGQGGEMMGTEAKEQDESDDDWD